MSTLNRFLDRVDCFATEFTEKDNSDRIWLARRGVYLTIFIYFLMFLPRLKYFFGPESLRYGNGQVPDWFGWLVRLLFTEQFQAYYLWFIGGLFVTIVLGSLQPLVRVMSILVYFFAENLFNKGEYITNGSATATSLLLIYFVFMSENKQPIFNQIFSYPNNLITNTAFLMAQLQICILYLVAGMSKLMGDEWLAGEAFYYTLNFAFFSQQALVNQLFKSDLALYFSNYLALGYQLTFAVLIWIKPVKKWLLFVGAGMHVGIIVLNGLVDFGLIMLASYLLFIDNSTAKRIRGIFPKVI